MSETDELRAEGDNPLMVSRPARKRKAVKYVIVGMVAAASAAT
jgi:hypothetical protein